MATRLQQMKASREENVVTLHAKGIPTFPQESNRTHYANQALEADDLHVTVAGRLLSMRGHGKIQFADLVDKSGKIQLVFKVDELSQEQFENVNLLDTGDIVEASGSTFTTQSGQRSVLVKSYRLLSKAMRPLPNQWHGLKDVEERYRQRYVDLTLNPEVRQVFETRSKIVSLLRKFFDERGFLEVETPILQPIYGGATAKPFLTHHNALDYDYYLRIADELYLKRLIVGGFEKVYEIGHDFRNEGMSRAHNPEFTQIEFYWAYATYEDLMTLTEELFTNLLDQVKGTRQITYQGKEINFNTPWPRVRYRDAVLEHSGIDIDVATTEESLLAAIGEKGIKLDLKGVVGYAAILDALYKKTTRPHLIGPLFLMDYPYEMKPLAKRKADNPKYTANFQLLVAGEELINAYNELNDPGDQRARWEEEALLAEGGLEEHQVIDEDYIRALEYGMPPTAGWGLGVDRLTMVLTDSASIKDVILFPTLKPEFAGPSQRKKQVSISRNDPFSISTEVKEKFPGIFYSYVSIVGVDIKKSHPELEALKQKVVVEHTLPLEQVAEVEGVKAYRELFKATKVWGDGRRPSPEALLRRLAQGKGLYNVNTAVDAYNLAVIETGIGLGGFNHEKLSLPVILRFTEEGEVMHLLGDNGPTRTKSGELAYADQEKLITLDVNYRDIDMTKLTTDTTTVMLFADGAPGLEKEQVVAALKRGAEYIREFCGGTISEITIVE